MDYQDPDQRLKSTFTKALGNAGRVWLVFVTAPMTPVIWYGYGLLPAVLLAVASVLLFPWLKPDADYDLEKMRWDNVALAAGLAVLLGLVVAWAGWG